MMDGKKLVDVKLPLLARVVEKVALRKISNTVVEDLLVRYDLIEPEKAAAV
jgi:oleate hydratase